MESSIGTPESEEEEKDADFEKFKKRTQVFDKDREQEKAVEWQPEVFIKIPPQNTKTTTR